MIMKSNKKYSLISVGFFCLIVSFIAPTIPNNNFINDYNKNNKTIQKSESIDPIIIYNNNDLASHPNITGNGILGDPYIIEDFEFIGSGDGGAIRLSNINKPLIIRNCTIRGYQNGIFLFNASNVEILNNTVSNNFYGIFTERSNNNIIRSNNASYNTGLGIYLFHNSDTNSIIDNLVLNNTFTGLVIDNSDNNILINNTALKNLASGIYLYNSNNNTITNNTAINNERGFHLSSADYNTLINNTSSYNYKQGFFLDFSDCNKIQNDTTLGNYQSGIYLQFSDNNTLISNIAINNSLYGLFFYNSEYCISFNNIMKSCGIGLYGSLNYLLSLEINESNTLNDKPIYYFKNQVGLDNTNFTNPGQIIFVNCTHSEISEINISDSSFAINLLYSDNNTLINNTASNNNVGGIFLYNSNNNTLISNNVLNNSYYGIYVQWWSNENIIIDNIASNNEECGIYIDTSEKNILMNNTASNNGECGIILEDSDYNILTKNIITQNEDIGISLQFSSENNTIYNNILIKNNINARDNGGKNNNWYNDTTGNYWDDYSGMDLNNDGIGESPYNIASYWNSQDLYPICDFGPNITILYPISIIEIGTNKPSFIVEDSDFRIDTMWYSLNGGENIIFPSNFTINQIEWDLLSNGIVIITFYVNNTEGHIFSENIIITKKSIPIIISPDYNEEFDSEAPSFIVEISDPQLDTMWYSLNGGRNITFTSNGTINQVEWELLQDGIVTLTFYANDTSGNIALENITIIKNTKPIMTIINPSINEIFDSEAPSFIVEVSHSQLGTMWYSLNGGRNIIFTSNGTISQIEWDALPNGIITITFYANNTQGKVTSENITIVKNTTLDDTIPSYPIMMIVLISVITVIILINNFQKKKARQK